MFDASSNAPAFWIICSRAHTTAKSIEREQLYLESFEQCAGCRAQSMGIICVECKKWNVKQAENIKKGVKKIHVRAVIDGWIYWYVQTATKRSNDHWSMWICEWNDRWHVIGGHLARGSKPLRLLSLSSARAHDDSTVNDYTKNITHEKTISKFNKLLRFKVQW